jgi:hypothetical protein
LLAAARSGILSSLGLRRRGQDPAFHLPGAILGK